MGLLEDYHEYKKGVLPRFPSRPLLNFFKTKPTEEQVMYIEKHNKYIELIAMLGILLYLILGIGIGFFMGFIQGLGY